MTIITLNPTNPVVAPQSAFQMAPRPKTLKGQVLGIVANGLGDSEFMFDAIGYLLSEMDDIEDVVKVVKHSVAVPPEPQQWVDITEKATVAVTGFGGCGSCSTRSMRDAIELERIGIPAVCIVHEALVPGVKALASVVGAADYPFVLTGYPYDPTGHWTKEECYQMAKEVLAGVRERLTLG